MEPSFTYSYLFHCFHHFYRWIENVVASRIGTQGKFVAAGGMALAIFGTIFLYEDPTSG